MSSRRPIPRRARMTPAESIVQFQRRKARRLIIPINDIEPQSKKMPDAQQDQFQEVVMSVLSDLKSQPFSGPIALDVRLSTTRPTAPQAHTIAKNLLDLLECRRAGVRGSRSHVLYKNDSQIHALAVSCTHGKDHPHISIRARTLSAMLKDLELAGEALRHLDEEDPARWYQQEFERDSIDDFRRLVEQEAASRSRLGDKLYEAMLKFGRWQAQRSLFKRSGVTPAQLCWLFGLPKNPYTGVLNETWDTVFRDAPLRMQVGALPIKSGESDAFKKRIDTAIEAFKARWDWLIQPLVVPLALEVLIRPSFAAPKASLKDLDNLVREYILPRIVPAFGTVTDHRWTIDFDELRRTDPALAKRWGPTPTPPKATRDGVTRYEAWRLPPIKGKDGFVSIALALDEFEGSLLQQIDELVDGWAEQVRAKV